MKLRTVMCVLGATVVLPAVLAGPAIAAPWTTDQVVAYLCTEAHDAAFYHDYAEAEKMHVWKFNGDIVPEVEARKKVFGTGELNDTTRAGQCGEKRTEFLDAVDAITTREKDTLRAEYRDNSAAIKAFPAKKLAAFSEAGQSEMRRKNEKYPQ
ncbi:hypothetical protein ACFWU5_20365 [Nocardia sp. NPDC058640]|uniref:hypothetical protein n=1 Tax=Nocardia sp. NPDC058640 TaxID=3346571 RepID=UPI003669EAE6